MLMKLRIGLPVPRAADTLTNSPRYSTVMNDAFILGVPSTDQDDLVELTRKLNKSPEFSEQRYFDGAAFMETLLPMVISAPFWATLTIWIRARADVQKTTRIAFRGVEITAMNRKDAERIISTLLERVNIEHVDE